MTTIRFFVPGAAPVAWRRGDPKIVWHGHRCPACRRGMQAYAAIVLEGERVQEMQRWQSDVRAAAALVYSGPPITEPCAMGAVFIFPRAEKYKRKRMAMPRIVMRDTPDLDNLEKAIADAISFKADFPERVGVILRDDRQICVRDPGGKYQARHETGSWDIGEPIGAEITIRVLTGVCDGEEESGNEVPAADLP